MAIVRIEALRALELLIAGAIPTLAGHICVGIAPSSETETYPNLSMQPTRWSYEPEQELEHAVLPGNVRVISVGQHVSPMVISIVTASLEERWDLEAKVLDLFASATRDGYHRPGVLVVPVTACPDLSRWMASFELESDEWNDANAFDRRYESKIIVTAIIPALVIERNVYTILELQLGLTQDMATAFNAATFKTDPSIEVVTINADGTLTPS